MVRVPTKTCSKNRYVVNFAAIQCPPPPSVMNSDVAVEGVHYSHELTYTCHTGYAYNPNTTLDGGTVTTTKTVGCSANGLWVDEQGIWNPIDCLCKCVNFCFVGWNA